MKIKFPKDKSLIDNLEPIFNEIEELQKEIKELNETYNNQLKELSKAAIINQEILNTNEIINEELTEYIKEISCSVKTLEIIAFFSLNFIILLYTIYELFKN
jgi:mevalonate kinase